MALEGAWIGLEHPADPKRQFPSFFASSEVQGFMDTFRLQYQEAAQCMYGSVSKKPTGLLLLAQGKRVDVKFDRCHSHAILRGRAENGTFCTSDVAAYPSNFCQASASCFAERVVAVKTHGYQRPYRPRRLAKPEGTSAKDPWFQLHDVRWAWVEPHPGCLVENIEAHHARKVYASSDTPQQ